MCKFSWTKGEYCTSVDDENDAKHRLNAGRSWSIKLRTNQYCSNAMDSSDMIAATHEEGEDRNDNALWKKKAYDLDLPNENGKYLIAMAYSTGGWFISELNQEVPPSIQMCIATSTATVAKSGTSGTVEEGHQKRTLTSTTHVLKTIENTGHGIVVEIKKNEGKGAHRLIRTTLWLWHTALLKDTSGKQIMLFASMHDAGTDLFLFYFYFECGFSFVFSMFQIVQAIQTVKQASLSPN